MRYRGASRIEIVKMKWEFLTTHIARKTFITLSLERGMRPEVIMSITGHANYKAMKPYIKIVDKVKSEELYKAWKN